MRLLTIVQPRTQDLDARVVVVFAFCLIFVTRSLAEPEMLLRLEALLVVAALLFGVNLARLLKRSLFVLPFTLAALPLVFTASGPTWFNLAGFTGSKEGLAQWLIVVGHCWICYQILLGAVAKVGPFGFIDGLAGLGLPGKLVDILRLALRYLDLLLDEASRLQRARVLRAGPDSRSWVQRATTTGAMVGTLFLRSLDRASRVELARSCRGGPLRKQNPLLRGKEIAQISLILLATVLFVFL